MKFGVNEGVNEKSKKVGIRHNMGGSKLKLPHVVVKNVKSPVIKVESKKEVAESSESRHETNKTVYMIAAVGLGWYLFR